MDADNFSLVNSETSMTIRSLLVATMHKLAEWRGPSLGEYPTVLSYRYFIIYLNVFDLLPEAEDGGHGLAHTAAPDPVWRP